MHNNSKHVKYLDGWRGVAILIVLLSHFYSPLHQFGALGVGVFFVLSGYLMSNLLFIKKVRLPYFFMRRASRILPAFIFFVISMVVYATSIKTDKYVPSIAEIISVLTFLSAYFPSDVNLWASNWPIGHIWSLNVEEHSYLWLALGVVITGGARTDARVMYFLLLSVAATVLFLFIYRIWPPSGATRWELHSECASTGLLAAAAYRVFLHHGYFQLKARVPKYLPLLAIAVAVVAFSDIVPVFIQQTLGPLLLAFAINHLDDTFEWFRRVLSGPIITWLGTCSFSLYLWQQIFYVEYHMHQVISGIAGLVLALIAGASSFYVIENPARIFLNKKFSPSNPSR